jgi:hypothetical protein
MTLVLNVAFLAISFLATLTPQEMIAERVRQAFASGELGESDYLRYDAGRGQHQYNDCNILQMMSNADASRAGRAWGPWLYLRDSSALDVCATLRELVVDGRDPSTLLSQRYSRYWHGYIPVLSVLLSIMDISSARGLLRAWTYASVLILFLAGFRHWQFLPLAGAVAFAGLFFWGLPYFGQGFSHALGDTVVMLGIASLVYWPRRLARTSSLLPFCAAFGAIVVYVEMLTGPLPMAAGLLFPTAYCVSRVAGAQDDRIWGNLKHATMALAAFGLGAALTVGVRIGIAAVALEPSGLDILFGNLAAYTAGVDRDLPIPAFLHPLWLLARSGRVLTYGSTWGMVVLYVSSLAAWFSSLWIARARGTHWAWSDLAAFAVGAAAVPAWSLLLPAHTAMHAGFMARIMIVPISLSWALLFWQLCFGGGVIGCESLPSNTGHDHEIENRAGSSSDQTGLTTGTMPLAPAFL